MKHYKILYQLARALQSEHRFEDLPAFLLKRAVRHVEARRGFIVVSEEGDFREKSHIGYSEDGPDSEQRRFSRSLVRKALREGKMIQSQNLAGDARFAAAESARALGGIPVLAAPLRWQGAVYAVIYLEKGDQDPPFDEDQQLFLSELADLAGQALHNALELRRLERLRLQHDDFFTRYDFEGLVGRHPAMIALFELIAQVADSDATLLVRGETGTGKELVARSLYKNSGRRHKPFVTLHCGALPETLFEAELFGHEKGAFTGADRHRAGRIAEAAGGTLFIDEVAEMPIAVQAKLLRFFQSGEVQRIGADQVETVDVRIIAATHQDLEDLVERGSFRRDLYYRLNVVQLELPPLRKRKSDIPFLIDAFLDRYWKKPVKPSLSHAALTALTSYDYPGNVRELAHLIERACLLTRDARIDLDALPEPIRRAGEVVRTGEEPILFPELTNDALKSMRDRAGKAAVNRVEIAFLEKLMARFGDDVAAAAEHAGMQKTYLYKLLARHDLRKPSR